MVDRARTERILTAIERVLDADERIESRGGCWVALRRPHVPLLLLGRRRHDAFVTDRRLVLVARRRGALRSSDVTLAKRLDTLALEAQHRRPTLLQQRIRAEPDVRVVVEWPRRSRAVAGVLAAALRSPAPRPAP